MGRRWLASVVVVVVAALGHAPATASAPREGEGGGLRVVRARSFVAPSGHVFTTATVMEGGRSRVVTAPGGRIGDRWERVEAVAPAGSPAAAADERLRDGLFLADAAGKDGSGVPTLLGYGWCARQLPVSYRVHLGGAPKAFLPAVHAGFTTWETEAETFLDFRHAGPTSISRAGHDGTNVVWFDRRTEGYLGYTWVYGSGDRILGFDMLLNRRYKLVVGGLGYDVQSLVTHEAGHAAGFGHSGIRYDVMYRSLAWAAKKRHLGSGDFAMVHTHYGLRDIRASIVSIQGPPTTMRSGETAEVSITYRNIGRTPWGWGRAVPLQVRTDRPPDRSSPFAHSSWAGPHHPGSVRGALCRGETATASWTMQAPLLPLQYEETFVLRTPVEDTTEPGAAPLEFEIRVRPL